MIERYQRRRIVATCACQHRWTDENLCLKS